MINIPIYNIFKIGQIDIESEELELKLKLEKRFKKDGKYEL